MSLFHASTCFEHYVLIVRKSKSYYTASGIIELCRWPSSAQVERGSLNPCTGQPPIGVMIPEPVQYDFDLLTMSTFA